MFQESFTLVTDAFQKCFISKAQNVVILKLPACYMLLMFIYHAAY